MRAQLSYPTGFALDVMGSLLVAVTEFGEVWVIFHNVHVLGGLTFDAVLVLFGLSNLGFGTADLLFGHLDTLPVFIRAGTLDAFYLRPLPVLTQLMTSELDLRRVARMAVFAITLVVGLRLSQVVWNLHNVALVAISLVFGTVIFCALFVCAASLQFFLINAPELTNSFTYGGSYASSQPAADLPDSAQAVVRLPGARRLHRLPADARAAPPARPGAAAGVAGLADPGGRPLGLAGRAPSLALGHPPLPRRRRVSEAVIDIDGADPHLLGQAPGRGRPA